MHKTFFCYWLFFIFCSIASTKILAAELYLALNIDPAIEAKMEGAPSLANKPPHKRPIPVFTIKQALHKLEGQHVHLTAGAQHNLRRFERMYVISHAAFRASSFISQLSPITASYTSNSLPTKLYTLHLGEDSSLSSEVHLGTSAQTARFKGSFQENKSLIPKIQLLENASYSQQDYDPGLLLYTEYSQLILTFTLGTALTLKQSVFGEDFAQFSGIIRC